MRITKLVFILLSVFFYCTVNAQYLMKCDDVIYPGCPGSGGSNGLILNNNFKNSPICDTAYIIHPPMFGTIEYVGSGGNLEVNDMYNYTTNTNCETEDRFLAVECCTDSTGIFACDTIDYGIHLSFECQTPPDLFCCIPDNGQPITFAVLENDAEFIQATYPGFQPLEVFVGGIIMQPANGTAVQGPSFDEITYIPSGGFTGVDSVVYEVFYYLQDPVETITICDEQTAYIVVEDCIQTVTDELTVSASDTIYFNALANDYIEPDIEHPCIDTLDCQNPLPQLFPGSFSVITPPPYLSVLQNGNLCFTSPESGCFSYEYEVCSTVGVCDKDSIIVKVESSWNYCDPVIDLGNSPLFSNTIQAQYDVISSGTVVSGANVSLKAGQTIKLEQGFNSNTNTNVSLIIEDCSPTCCTTDPLSEPWMQPFVNDPIYIIEQATAPNSDCIFIITDVCSPFEITRSYYDCTGNLICQVFQFGGDCSEVFLEELYDLILLKECG